MLGDVKPKNKVITLTNQKGLLHSSELIKPLFHFFQAYRFCLVQTKTKIKASLFQGLGLPPY